MLLRSILIATCLTQLALPQGIIKRGEKPIPPAVENIYQRGLRYLADSQKENGAWSDSGYGGTPGVVGLAVMAFLAHGEDPNFGPYSKNIKKAVDYIISKQRESDGYFAGDGRGSMYSHGFATLALAECYGMYRDPRVGTALKKAVKLSLDAQAGNPHGGWRYGPESSSADSSVVGCVLVSLYAARNAGIPVPDDALKKGLTYMRSCRGNDGSFGYQPRSGGRETLTAIGQLCEALAKGHETPGFKKTSTYLGKKLNYREKNYPYYFEYYMSQALFHTDEELFNTWNDKNTRYLSAIQAANGSFPGRGKGEAFNTSSALLSLALNYRLLPIYEK